MMNETPDPADSALAVWSELVVAHDSLLEAVERRLMAEAAMPVSWHQVLIHLSRAGPHGIRMQELARSVLLSKSGLTRLADRMEAAGLVARRSCPSDRRGMYIVITDQGTAALERATPVFTSAVEDHLSVRLSPHQVGELARLLARVGPEDDARPSEGAALAVHAERVS